MALILCVTSSGKQKKKFVSSLRTWRFRNLAGQQVFHNNIFCLDNQMRWENQNIIGEKPNKVGVLVVDNEIKRAAWKKHYKQLSNVEFECLSEEPPIERLASEIILVIGATGSMKIGKAASPFQMVVEMQKFFSETSAILIYDLITSIIYNRRISSDWKKSIIITLYKGKNALVLKNNYRGLKLINQLMKMLE